MLHVLAASVAVCSNVWLLQQEELCQLQAQPEICVNFPLPSTWQQLQLLGLWMAKQDHTACSARLLRVGAIACSIQIVLQQDNVVWW